MPMANCCCCDKTFDQHLMLKCSICSKLYKNSCVDITASEVRIMNSNKGYNWSCINCREIGNDLKSLRALIIDLQNDIKLLREENNVASEGVNMEEIIAEISDRERRKKNIMIFNVKEQSHDEAMVRVENDKVVITEIMNILSPESEIEIKKPVRLGRMDSTKTRPIRISLNSEEQVHTIIKNARALKDNRTFRNVSIAYDRTPRQLEYFKKIKNQLRDKENSDNYTIKYINGTPKIVSKTRQSLN